MNRDLQALREYVTGPTSQNQAETTVRLLVTHSNLNAKFMDIVFDLCMTVDSLKNKLCFHCGTNASAMVLQLKDQSGALLAVMDNPSTKLGFFSPKDGYILHIIDTDPLSVSANGWLEDTSKVAKYVMSDEDYNKRDNTYRKYKQDKLREDPSWTLDKEIAARRGVPYDLTPPKAKVEDEDFQEEEAKSIEVGARCEVTSPEGGKRGFVKYVGKCEGLPLGWWVGVQYDEPVGKNDGSVKGNRFFECPERYGGFVRPNLVKMGDEFTPFDEEFEFSDEDEI